MQRGEYNFLLMKEVGLSLNGGKEKKHNINTYREGKR